LTKPVHIIVTRYQLSIYVYERALDGQLSLAIPPWVAAMSTSKRWQVNRHAARYTSRVFMALQCKLVSDWRLQKRISAPACGRM